VLSIRKAFWCEQGGASGSGKPGSPWRCPRQRPRIPRPGRPAH